MNSPRLCGGKSLRRPTRRYCRRCCRCGCECSVANLPIMSVSFGRTEFGCIHLPISDITFIIGGIICVCGGCFGGYVNVISPFRGRGHEICVVSQARSISSSSPSFVLMFGANVCCQSFRADDRRKGSRCWRSESVHRYPLFVTLLGR